MAARVARGLLGGALLLVAQAVLDGRGRVLDDAVVLAELVEAHVSRVWLDFEPLGAWLVPHVELAQVTVEVRVMEGLARVLEGCVAVPLELVHHVDRVRLLLEAFPHVLLGVADLGPAVVAGDLGRGVGVYLRQRRTRGLDEVADVGESHDQIISFTCDSMKSISSSVSPYFA